MDQTLLNEIIERAAKKAVKEYAEEHPCRLSESERSMIHAQHEAMDEEGGNHGTWRVLIQWGVNLTDVTKQVRRAVLWILGIIAAVALIKWQWK